MCFDTKAAEMPESDSQEVIPSHDSDQARAAATFSAHDLMFAARRCEGRRCSGEGGYSESDLKRCS